MTMPFQIYSIGFASQQLQLPIAVILTTANQLGIVPSSINGVLHFNEGDAERIRAAAVAGRRSSLTDQRSQAM